LLFKKSYLIFGFGELLVEFSVLRDQVLLLSKDALYSLLVGAGLLF
jgi:hypothetical protein